VTPAPGPGGAKDEQGKDLVMPFLRQRAVLSKADDVHMSYEVSPKGDYIDVQVSHSFS
jgi:hypothetical protein